MAEDKIISFNNETEVREMAKQTAEALEAPQKEQASLFEDLANELANYNPEMGGMEELATLLSLPEEQFQIVAPIFLDELTRTFTNINDTMVLVQTMNASGIKLEDIRSEFDAVIKAIDEMPDVDGLLSKSKKDFLKSMIGLSINAIMESEGIEKRILDVPVQLDTDAKLPVYAHLTDAGADIFALEDIDIPAGEHKVIHTGVHMLAPKGYEIQVRAKSGISAKTNLILKNGVGTIDEFYTGDISVILANIAPPIKSIALNEDGTVASIEYGAVEHIEKGQKIAQVLLAESPKMHFYTVEKLMVPDGTRAQGGFGSTGK